MVVDLCLLSDSSKCLGNKLINFIDMEGLLSSKQFEFRKGLDTGQTVL